jgi:hypothetical protein
MSVRKYQGSLEFGFQVDSSRCQITDPATPLLADTYHGVPAPLLTGVAAFPNWALWGIACGSTTWVASHMHLALAHSGASTLNATSRGAAIGASSLLMEIIPQPRPNARFAF